jgi:hypothetical protein
MCVSPSNWEMSRSAADRIANGPKRTVPGFVPEETASIGSNCGNRASGFVPSNCEKGPKTLIGGAGGIRTLDRALQPYNGLANRRLQPLGHSSVTADMPEAEASRKRADSGRRIPGHLGTRGRLI